MMQDRSPRAVWQPSNRSVHRSQSTRNSPNMSSLGYNAYSNSSLYPTQPGRIYSTPPPQIRPYNTISRSRPNTTNVRVNDGTHPRMPMRAVQPQTYHGVPVQSHVQPRFGHPTTYENHYGTVRRSMPYANNTPQGMSHARKANSQGDMRTSRGRVYSDHSPTQTQVDGGRRSIRSANSEPDIDQPHPERQYSSSSHVHTHKGSLSIPSGTYVASSSMTSLPQYAQLMPPSNTPHRSDSVGSVRRPSGLQLDNVGTRHSYSAGTHQHKLSIPGERVNSYDDVFNESKSPYKRAPTTPTSPVSRQPSYLTAMSAPIRQSKWNHLNHRILKCYFVLCAIISLMKYMQ